MLLRDAGQKTRHVNERHDRNFERVAEAHKTRGFARRVDVEHASQHHRLVGHKARGASLDAAKPDQDVTGMARLHFEEVAFIDDLQDQLAHVVGFVGAVGDQRVEARLEPVSRIMGRPFRHAGAVGQRQKIEEIARRQQRVDVVLERHVGDA